MLYYLKLRDGASGKIETVGAGEGMADARAKLAGVLGFLLVDAVELFDPRGDGAEDYWGVYEALAADRLEEAVGRWNTRNTATGGNYLSLVDGNGQPVMELGGDCYYRQAGHPDAPPEQAGAYARWDLGPEEVRAAGEERYGGYPEPEPPEESPAAEEEAGA